MCLLFGTVKQPRFSGSCLLESSLSPVRFFKSEAGKQNLKWELDGIDWKNKIRNIFIITVLQSLLRLALIL